MHSLIEANNCMCPISARTITCTKLCLFCTHHHYLEHPKIFTTDMFVSFKKTTTKYKKDTQLELNDVEWIILPIWVFQKRHFISTVPIFRFIKKFSRTRTSTTTWRLHTLQKYTLPIYPCCGGLYRLHNKDTVIIALLYYCQSKK